MDEVEKERLFEERLKLKQDSQSSFLAFHICLGFQFFEDNFVVLICSLIQKQLIDPDNFQA